MNKIDEYYFWLQKALAEPINKNNTYFYDKAENALFSVSFDGDDFLPNYRNNYTKKNEQTKNSFENEIRKLKRGSADVVKMSRLSFTEKKIFLIQYVLTAKLNEEMLFKANSYLENDEFDFQNNFKRREEWNLRLEYEIALGRFFKEKIKKMYEPLGISEQSLLIW